MSALRLSLLLPLIVLASVSKGQTDSTRRWTIGAGVAAGSGYRTLSNTTTSNTAYLIIRSRDEREEQRIAFGGHVGAGYQLSRRIGFEAGVGYVQQGWQGHIDAGNFIFRDPVDPFHTDPAIPERITFNEVFHYLDLRLGATLTLGQGRWRSV